MPLFTWSPTAIVVVALGIGGADEPRLEIRDVGAGEAVSLAAITGLERFDQRLFANVWAQ